MSGFRKAKAEQAFLKMGLYGPPGSGKTFTSLLLAEGLAKLSNKKIAYIDTEHGTDFYCKAVPSRSAHPSAFEFDALYSKSIMEALAAVKGLNFKDYGVLVIDSITHLWEACIASYGGKQTSIGSIPIYAWGKIKKPYKELMSILLSIPAHVLICGRQGMEYGVDDSNDEMKVIGVKMKAESETPYEPHILLRMESIKPTKTGEVATIFCYAEKDRTGILAGKVFQNPTFNDVCAPLLSLLGSSQAPVPTIDMTAAIDADHLAQQESDKAHSSQTILEDFIARITLCKKIDELLTIGKEITPQLKAQLLTEDISTLRQKYLEREKTLSI